MKCCAFNVFSRGESHVQKGTVCQDASYSCAGEKYSLAVVADGHGSKQYFRSDIGSQLAVQCTVDVIEECMELEHFDEMFKTPKQLQKTLTSICNSIIAKWHIAINENINVRPFTKEELADLPDKYIQDYLECRNTETAYGTTLIAVFTVGDRCFGIQIGDGKCVAIYENGTADEPIPWDDRCCFNITTSLCDKEASLQFRFAEIYKPVIVFVGTDGIDDTYGVGLQNFYLNVAAKIIELGYEDSIEQIQKYINDIAARGSRDDTSLACLVDIERLCESKANIDNNIVLSNLKVKLQKLEQFLPDIIFKVSNDRKIFEELSEQLNCNNNDAALIEKYNIAKNRFEASKQTLQEHENKIQDTKNQINCFADKKSKIEVSEGMEEQNGSKDCNSEMRKE